MKRKRTYEDPIKIKVSMYDEVTVSKGVANYICMLTSFAIGGAMGEGRDELAREFEKTAKAIYETLEGTGYYER